MKLVKTLSEHVIVNDLAHCCCWLTWLIMLLKPLAKHHFDTIRVSKVFLLLYVVLGFQWARQYHCWDFCETCNAFKTNVWI